MHSENALLDHVLACSCVSMSRGLGTLVRTCLIRTRLFRSASLGGHGRLMILARMNSSETTAISGFQSLSQFHLKNICLFNEYFSTAIKHPHVMLIVLYSIANKFM